LFEHGSIISALFKACRSRPLQYRNINNELMC